MPDDNKRKRELENEVSNLVRLVNKLQMEIGELKNNLARYHEILDSFQEVIFEIDPEGKLLYCNKRTFEFFGYSTDDSSGECYGLSFVVPEDRKRAQKNLSEVILGKRVGISEYMVKHRDGHCFPILIHSYPIIRDGRPVGVRGVIMDVSEQKRYNERLQFISVHDSHTGLYNRTYFEQEMERYNNYNLPVGLIICDLDGLKLVNDTMGHDAGDVLLKATATIIKKCFRENDLVARIGGDEFAILLPNSDEHVLASAYQRLKDAVEQYNNTKHDYTCSGLPLSLSVGFAVSNEYVKNMSDVFQQADTNMYREKFRRSNSVRNDIVSTLLKTLETRDIITEEHAIRLSKLICDLAEAVGFPEYKLAPLQLLAQFYDIGKVAVPDSILSKPGELSYDEQLKMKMHCDIGYRIALSSPGLFLIADWILKHHEWWNGEGYPLGLKEEAIPLECRILAIADAYLAMTNTRPYRKALSVEEALAELKRCAGTQFDPHLVEKFFQIITEQGIREIGR